jgi:hypothetical protein
MSLRDPGRLSFPANPFLMHGGEQDDVLHIVIVKEIVDVRIVR